MSGSVFTVDRVRVHEDMSAETLAFSARLLRDGRSVGRVMNDGHGGCHRFEWDRLAGVPQEFRECARAALPGMSFEVEDAFVDHLVRQWRERGTGGALTSLRAAKRAQEWCQAADRLRLLEVRAAALGVALAVREHEPGARSVVLDASDQDDGLVPLSWSGDQGSADDLDVDEVTALAARLYRPQVLQVPGVSEGGAARPGCFVLTIDEVVEQNRGVLDLT